MAEYVFAAEPLPNDDVRLRWTRDGVCDPFNFWIVAVCDVEEAKRQIVSEMVGAGGLPTTAARNLAALKLVYGSAVNVRVADE